MRSCDLNKGRTRKISVFFFVFCLLLSFFGSGFSVSATEDDGEPATGPDWSIDADTAPITKSESLILMDVDTGVTLYEKNIHLREYPASITKLLTCLLAREHCELDETVTFSHEAVYGIERGSSHIGIDEGEQLSMLDSLYAALLESANEVSSGIAEHVGGSIEGFAQMMNDKVRELGGNDSNFVNANGLPDENHYTSAYDMALIARAFFQDEVLTEISGTTIHHISSSPTQKDDIDVRNHHRMLIGCQFSNRHPYEYTVGGKTGYTDVARNTLVTCAEKDGHRLICVALNAKTPNHYLDTIALFDYGFACYESPEIAARIDEKAQELAAEAKPEETEEEGEAGEAKEGQDAGQETENRAEPSESGEEGQKEDSDTESGEKEKGRSYTVLKISAAIVVFAAVIICAFFLYRSYCRERERRRKREEIMARHRAFKEREKMENEYE